MRPTTLGVLEDVARERDRQDAKWGEQNHVDHPSSDSWAELVAQLERSARERLGWNAWPPTWAYILAEEVGEALQEDDPAKLRAELIQVAAVAVAWVEALDRRGATHPDILRLKKHVDCDCMECRPWTT